MDKKQFIINLAASLVNFAVNMGIGFAITPFIVSRVGAEAYGFAGLANTMVGYATLFTIALNSVAGRFITVAYHQGGQTQGGCLFLFNPCDGAFANRNTNSIANQQSHHR